LFDNRAEQIQKLETKEDWEDYQNNLKEKIFASLDKFEKTPLNVQVTGKIKRENFSVEKVMFESHPNFFVTGCLYLPHKRQKPAPAIIYCSGHTDIAFRGDVYQPVILNLVAKGFVVFGLDPIGQGERLQYVNSETGKSKIGGSTTEHSYAGVQTLLTGTSLSDYFIWDGVRTIDFLLTRKEIDPERIGITGRSGGGTQSAMIAAFDDRIRAAAPECYITTFKRLLQSIGPQDAEQNMFNAIKLGFDHPDYLHLRAPKPTMVITTTHDFFSQQGARESFAEAQRSFSAFGKPENLVFSEDFGVHQSTQKNREAMYTFFQKHLNNPGDNSDMEVEIFKPEELWVTPTGQLQTSEIGITVFNLNQRYFIKQELTENDLKEKIKELAGVEFNRELTAAVYTGKYFSEETEIEKYFLENDLEDFVLPVYAIKNKNPGGKTLLWLSPEGKKGVVKHTQLKYYLNEGYNIVTADLPGIGELFDPDFAGDGYVQGVPFNYTFGAHLVGKSIPGIHAEGIDLLVQFVQNKFNGEEIHALSEGELSTALLVFASQKNIFSQIKFEKALNFGNEFIEIEYYDPKKAFHIIPGSLSCFSFDEARKLKILKY
jgi:cephalosporin-C deacetylase-like acetyl esterase